MKPEAPATKELLQYSFLALPLAFAGLPLYIHAPDYYARDLGLDLTVMGVVLLAVRLLDAIQDPIIGFLCDRLAERRVTTVISGVVLLMLGMIAIFSTPPVTLPIVLWFALSMILATTGFSIVSINLTTIGSFWKQDPQQRTRISAWREAFTLIGLLTASVVPAVLQYFLPPAQTYQWLAVIVVVLLLPATALFIRLITTLPVPDFQCHSGTPAFFRILTGREQAFYLICFLSHLAAALPAVLVLFFVRDYLQAGQWYGLFLLLYFVAGASCIGLWVKLAARIGKQRAWIASMLLAIVTFIGVLGLDAGDLFAYALICVFSGIALGADLALPPSILADRVSARSAEAEANQYYAVLALIPKFAVALVSACALLLLGTLNFNPGQENSSLALSGLLLSYALLPCLLKLTTVLMLTRLIRNEDTQYANSHRSTGNGVSDFS